jgi:carboxypeptidase Taq
MTVHYNETDVFQSIFGGLHEAGHSIQGQSRNPEWKWMILGEKSSAGINESQARFIENIIGRSPEFWNHYYERLQKLTNCVFEGISQEEFVKAANIIQPSKIRVSADEMTYALHIIIRFEIELALFSGELEASDIPQVWNEKYQDYLGVEIKNDAEGALQDTHWAWGYWGYFPTYALGNIYSGMILEALEKDIPDWKKYLSEGLVAPSVDWLRKNVHHKANLYDPERMLEEITGKKVTAQPFIDYLENKYTSLFG